MRRAGRFVPMPRCLAQVRARERKPCVGAATRPVAHAGSAAVRVGDELDDGEAEAGATAAAGLVGTAEAVKGAIAEPLREAVTLVPDVQLDEAVPLLDGELYGAAAVGQRVVDEVDQSLTRAHRVGVCVCVGRLDVDLAPESCGTARETLGR